MAQTVKVNEQGRVVIPLQLRHELGIRPGVALVAYIEDGRLVLEDRTHMLKRLQGEFRSHNQSRSSVVEELLAERRAKTADEASS